TPAAVVVVACRRALEAVHWAAVHQNLKPNLREVGVSESNAIHASCEAGRRSCPESRLGQQSAQLGRVFEIAVELILVRIERPNERDRDRGCSVIVGNRSMYTWSASGNLNLDFAVSLRVIETALENVDARLTDDDRTG